MAGGIKDLGQSVDSLPIEQRIERYRQYANAALRKANEIDSPDHKAEYLSMAAGWHTMAQELERVSGLLHPDLDGPPASHKEQ